MRALYFRPVLQIATRPDTTAKRGRVLRIVMAAALRARAGVAKLASSWRISFSFSSQSTRFASAGGLASNRASARASAAEADRLLEAWVETAFSIAALQFLGSGDGSPVMITYFAQRSPRAVAANRCICSSCASRTLSGRATVSRPSVDEPGRNALQLPSNAAAARDAVRTCPEKAIIDVPPALGPMPPGRCGTPMTTSPVAVLRWPWLAIGLPHPGSSDGRNPIKYKSMQLSDDFAVTSVWPVGAARRGRDDTARGHDSPLGKMRDGRGDRARPTAIISRLGSTPDLRPFSRLNWLGLPYPTSKAMALIEARPARTRRCASGRRMSLT